MTPANKPTITEFWAALTNNDPSAQAAANWARATTANLEAVQLDAAHARLIEARLMEQIHTAHRVLKDENRTLKNQRISAVIRLLEHARDHIHDQEES